MKNKQASGILTWLVPLVFDIAGFYYLPDGLFKFIVLGLISLIFILIFLEWIDSQLDITNAFFLLRQCKKYGIAGLYDATISETQVHVSNAQRVRIMVLSGNTLIKSIKESLILALTGEKKVLIQIIVGTKESEYVTDVEELESEDRENQISGEISTTESFLKEYLKIAARNRNPDLIGKIQIGYSTTQLRSSIILVDDDWGWLTLSLPPKRALQTVSFLLRKAENGILEDCINHFDKTWDILERKHKVLEIPKS
jgi:hypothetical protein